MKGMGNFMDCDVEHCAYNRDRKCGRENLPSISWVTSGEFRCGERVGYSVCKDYKEVGGDDGAD